MLHCAGAFCYLDSGAIGSIMKAGLGTLVLFSSSINCKKSEHYSRSYMSFPRTRESSMLILALTLIFLDACFHGHDIPIYNIREA